MSSYSSTTPSNNSSNNSSNNKNFISPNTDMSEDDKIEHRRSIEARAQAQMFGFKNEQEFYESEISQLQALLDHHIKNHTRQLNYEKSERENDRSLQKFQLQQLQDELNNTKEALQERTDENDELVASHNMELERMASRYNTGIDHAEKEVRDLSVVRLENATLYQHIGRQNVLRYKLNRSLRKYRQLRLARRQRRAAKKNTIGTGATKVE